jgi:hypothetical protein
VDPDPERSDQAGGQKDGLHTLGLVHSLSVPDPIGQSWSHCDWQKSLQAARAAPVKPPHRPAMHAAMHSEWPQNGVPAAAGLAATVWITGMAQATAPVTAALRRNSRRFSPVP